ncbi:hypothetical protein IV04_20870 [Serratia sp. Ag1]|nr:hypothetical protein JV45_25070 [Serratia sp. Ag2]KFK95651.1 hypothetical protein IV04_20870 [Serratia sp. Ag1]
MPGADIGKICHSQLFGAFSNEPAVYPVKECFSFAAERSPDALATEYTLKADGFHQPLDRAAGNSVVVN